MLVEEAKKKIGSTPLEEAIQKHPVETWRVWSDTYPRTYSEDSEVSSALRAGHAVCKVLSLHYLMPVQLQVTPASPLPFVADGRQMIAMMSNIHSSLTRCAL